MATILKVRKDVRLEPCNNCGKIIHRPPSTRMAHIFCNQTCRSEWQKKQPRKNVVVVKCVRCGTEIQKYQSQVAGKKKFFCSDCKGKKVSKNCPQCNIAFEVSWGNRDQKFCSNKCNNDSQVGQQKWTDEQRAAMSASRLA